MRVDFRSLCENIGEGIERPVIELSERNGAVVFSVRVQARASGDAIGGEWQGALKVHLTAPPTDNRANVALCRFLAQCLNISPSAVRILSGERSRTKRVEVRGVTAGQIRNLHKAPSPGKLKTDSSRLIAEN